MPLIPPPPNSFPHRTDQGYFEIPWQQFWQALHAGLAAPVDLATDVTGRLPYTHLEQATAASHLLGRGSASGAGDWEDIALGSNLTMTGTTLSAATSAPGGATGDLQYNNAGAFGGAVLKQPAVDVIEQVDGTTTQEARFYNTVSGGGANYERLTTKVAADVLSESAFTLLTEKAGTGATQGIQLQSAGSISLQIPGAFPTLLLYHDPTVNGGISLIPNVSGSVGVTVADQGGSLLFTTANFGPPIMWDILAGSSMSLLIGNTASGADFTKRFLLFDDTNSRIEVGNNPASGLIGSGRGFVFDATLNGLVANLPGAGPTGSVLYVTDALAPVMGAAVVGGGAAFALACFNGAAWNVIGV